MSFDRIKAVRLIYLPFWPAEVGTRGDVCSLVLEPLEGWQGRFDTQVIGDLPITNGHVEVDPNKDRRSVDITKVLELRNAEDCHPQP